MRTVHANPFLPQWADTEADVLEAVRRVGASGWYILGREVEAFERDLANYQASRHATGCASGLDAIELALRALGLRPGDRVLTTPVSAFATTLAIVRAGGVPVFIDVDGSGLMDLARARTALRADPSIRYLLPVHLYGFAIDRVQLAELKADFGVKVIEDCAQAVGATSHGRPVGSVGDAAAFSFYPTKNLGALGDGGALLTNLDALAERVRCLRDYGQTAKYVHEQLGMNSRLDELQAAILRTAFLPRLPAWTQRRRAIAERYRAGLAHRAVALVPPPEHSVCAWHLFPVRVAHGARTAFMNHMRTNSIQVAIHYPGVIPDQAALQEAKEAVCLDPLSAARGLVAEEVSLPIHPYLADDDIDYVIDADQPVAVVISLVLPIYKNAENLPALLAAVEELNRDFGGEFEAVFVVDGSPDDSWLRLNQALALAGFRSQLLSLSRNFGSFAAIRAGMREARGEQIAIMAADLQEPPELVLEFVRELRTGAYDVAIGTRQSRDDPWLSALLSTVFWAFYRRFVQADIPPGGVDIFACTKTVRDSLMRLPEGNSSLIGLLFWVGYRRVLVPYARRARAVGTSGWTLRKKMRYLADSVFSFTDLPIQLLLRIGALGLATSVVFAAAVLITKIFWTIPVPGYTATVLVVTFFGALNCFGLGIIGGYVWRTFENTKNRPNFIVRSHDVFEPQLEAKESSHA